MVREHLDLVGCPFAVPSPVFKGINYCEKFFVVDFVVDFRGLELPGVKGYRVEASFLVPL